MPESLPEPAPVASMPVASMPVPAMPIPAMPVAAMPVAVTPAEATPALSSNGSSRKTVMIVDDSPTIRKILGLTLERAGYKVVAEPDGESAIERLIQIVPDLILLDIAMPKIDGYEVCKRIKAGPAHQARARRDVVGQGRAVRQVKGHMAGASEYLTKPFETPAVLAVVTNYCEKPAERLSMVEGDLIDFHAAEPSAGDDEREVVCRCCVFSAARKTAPNSGVTVYFCEGTLVHAVADESVGDDAMYQLPAGRTAASGSRATPISNRGR